MAFAIAISMHTRDNDMLSLAIVINVHTTQP